MTEREILIVEDERLVAEDLKDALEEMGYEVIGIIDEGEKAIEKAGEKEPDLVLMDIVLKGDMDGIEAADEIKSELNIPVIYLTAYADDKRLERARTTEPYGYIVKPYRKRELHSNIEMAFYKHEMERKLKESEEKYRAIFENSGTAMAILEKNKVAEMVNEEMEKLTGYSKEKLEGKKIWTDFASEEDVEKMEEYHYRRREDPENTPSQYSFTFINRFGDARDILIQVGMIPGTDKSIVSLIDVTEERKRFKTMRESQEAFRNLVERSFDAVVLIARDGQIMEVNDNFCELLGYSDSELLEKDLEEFITDADGTKMSEALDEMFEGELKEESLSVECTTKEGDKIELVGRLSAIIGVDDEPLYVIWNIDM